MRDSQIPEVVLMPERQGISECLEMYWEYFVFQYFNCQGSGIAKPPEMCKVDAPNTKSVLPKLSKANPK